MHFWYIFFQIPEKMWAWAPLWPYVTKLLIISWEKNLIEDGMQNSWEFCARFIIKVFNYVQF